MATLTSSQDKAQIGPELWDMLKNQEPMQNSASGGAPMAEYAKWFSKQSRLPVEHVEKHPLFWDNSTLQMFLAEWYMGDAGMQSLLSKLQTMAQAAPAKKPNKENGGGKEEDGSSDDDMPELVAN